MRRPSVPLVLSFLALVLSLGGSAFAAKHYLITSKDQIAPKVLRQLARRGRAGPRGAQGDKGPTGERGAQGPPGLDGAPWAVVDANGALRRGSDQGVTVTKLAGDGTYQVAFPTNVTECAFLGTIGSGEQGGAAVPPGTIAVSGRGGTLDALYVQTFNSAGVLTDKPFHVVLVC